MGCTFFHMNIHKSFPPDKVLFSRTDNVMCACTVCVRLLSWGEWWLMNCTLPVVILADLPHSHQCFQVLIGLVGVDVVEGAAVPRITVGRRKVYCHLRQIHTQKRTLPELECSQTWQRCKHAKRKERMPHVRELTVNWIWQPPIM